VSAAEKKGHLTPEIELLLGQAYRAAMMNEKALACQEKILGRNPSYGPAAYERIILLSQMPDAAAPFEKAELRKIAAGLRGNVEERILDGYLALLVTNHEAAREDLEKAV